MFYPCFYIPGKLSLKKHYKYHSKGEIFPNFLKLNFCHFLNLVNLSLIILIILYYL